MSEQIKLNIALIAMAFTSLIAGCNHDSQNEPTKNFNHLINYKMKLE